MKENITLIALNAHLQQEIENIEALKVFADMNIIKEEADFLFMYDIQIGIIKEDPDIRISMVYRIENEKQFDKRKVKEYLYEIHPYLLEIVHCLLKQCLKV